jgi:hypothetical protein
MVNVGTINLATAISIGSSNNYVLVDGGTLQAAMLTCSNGAPNGAIFTGASSVTITNIVLPSAGQAMTFNGGTLNVMNSLISNGMPQVVGDGTQIAVLNLLPGGTNILAYGLTITNVASLTGSGLIAATSTVYGTLSPGGTAGVGTITNNGDFALQSGATTKVELNAYTTPGSGWDLLTVTNGTLTLSGTLNVLLIDGFSPTNTQSFVIMTNQTASSTIVNQAAFGSQVAARATEGGKVSGYFNVSVSSQSVVLNGYTSAKTSPGTFIFIR